MLVKEGNCVQMPMILFHSIVLFSVRTLVIVNIKIQMLKSFLISIVSLSSYYIFFNLKLTNNQHLLMNKC